MWYSDTDKPALDYSKPIVAYNGQNRYLLMPQKGNEYDIIGYDWFNLNTGEYNSCRIFKTAKDAVNCYKDHTVVNEDIITE